MPGAARGITDKAGITTHSTQNIMKNQRKRQPTTPPKAQDNRCCHNYLSVLNANSEELVRFEKAASDCGPRMRFRGKPLERSYDSIVTLVLFPTKCLDLTAEFLRELADLEPESSDPLRSRAEITVTVLESVLCWLHVDRYEAAAREIQRPERLP